MLGHDFSFSLHSPRKKGIQESSTISAKGLSAPTQSRPVQLRFYSLAVSNWRRTYTREIAPVLGALIKARQVMDPAAPGGITCWIDRDSRTSWFPNRDLVRTITESADRHSVPAW